jgi:hypothetical protein
MLRYMLMSGLLLVSGCAAEPVRMPFMVAPASLPAPSYVDYRGAIAVEPVAVRTRPPPWGAGVSESVLREALVNSLAVRGLFVYGRPEYGLSATLERVDQKLDELVLGLDITVGVTMRYELKDSLTGGTVLRREISTADTQPFRYLSAKERSQAALEAAIRRNIAAFLDGLAQPSPSVPGEAGTLSAETSEAP